MKVYVMFAKLVPDQPASVIGVCSTSQKAVEVIGDADREWWQIQEFELDGLVEKVG